MGIKEDIAQELNGYVEKFEHYDNVTLKAIEKMEDEHKEKIEKFNEKWGEDIFDYLSSEFNNDENNLIVLFMLSDNYYSSVACLNEMGATWVLKKEYRSILLPGFEFKKIEGAINPNKIAIKLDKEKDMRYSLTDVRKQMAEWFDLENIEEQRWDRIRDKFIESVEKIRAEQEK